MTQDKWSEWLLHKRFGGNEKAADQQMRMLRRVRDLVLDKAELKPGQTLLDVGAGDGLIAFGALERMGDTGRVIFADISQPLLDQAASIAAELGVSARCTFVNASADDLVVIQDASIDVVSTRSVLIYVKDKLAAFREFERVLKPGGRLSLWEPINRFAAAYGGPFWGDNIEGIEDLAARLRAFYRELQPLDSDPMMEFDERDLFRLCEAAGFRYIRVDVSLFAAPMKPVPWEIVMNVAGNPNVPSIAGAMGQIFDDDERRRFESAVRPRVESGGSMTRNAVAHLIAVKDGGAEPPDLSGP